MVAFQRIIEFFPINCDYDNSNYADFNSTDQMEPLMNSSDKKLESVSDFQSIRGGEFKWKEIKSEIAKV